MPEAIPPQGDTVEILVARFLRTVPETWTDHNLTTLSELQERAVYLLTAAGMIERRVTLRLRMVGHPALVEATITMTGEAGLAQAMEFVLKDIWHDWREAFEQRGDGPVSHCERIGNEQWRLTTEGVAARNDLDAGNAATVFDFVLRRGFFDGQPRLLPDGRISRRLPVGGRGALERMRRVSGDASPANMAIANWEAGGQAFAAAFAELLKAKQAADESAPAPTAGNARSSQKRSTERGEAEAKLIAALTKHHQYADGSCLNLDPIGNNQLAKAASVSPSTASAFFDGKFQGHAKYRALCRNASKLIAALKLLNDEFAPFHLLGNSSTDVAAPADEDSEQR